jgi:DNA-directed RNA polymerase sigma subunit (sigma70/sigma32)
MIHFSAIDKKDDNYFAPEYVQEQNEEIDVFDMIRHLLTVLPTDDASTIKRKEIVRRYFKGETLQEIGNDLDISRERVRQIREVAVSRLREDIVLAFPSLARNPFLEGENDADPVCAG